MVYGLNLWYEFKMSSKINFIFAKNFAWRFFFIKVDPLNLNFKTRIRPFLWFYRVLQDGGHPPAFRHVYSLGPVNYEKTQISLIGSAVFIGQKTNKHQNIQAKIDKITKSVISFCPHRNTSWSAWRCPWKFKSTLKKKIL